MDEWTDRQTDKMSIAKTALHGCSTVKKTSLRIQEHKKLKKSTKAIQLQFHPTK